MTPLFDHEIQSFCTQYNINLIKILMRDETDQIGADGFYLLNLDTSDSHGTHWVGLMKRDGEVAYFDPLGFPPVEEIKNKYDVVYNPWQVQESTSKSCGYFVAYWMWYMSQPGSSDHTFYNFLHQEFGDDPNTNEIYLLEHVFNITS